MSKPVNNQTGKPVSMTQNRPKGLRPTRNQSSSQTSQTGVTVHKDPDSKKSVSRSLLNKTESRSDSHKEPDNMLSVSTHGPHTSGTGLGKLDKETSHYVLKVGWIFCKMKKRIVFQHYVK